MTMRSKLFQRICRFLLFIFIVLYSSRLVMGDELLRPVLVRVAVLQNVAEVKLNIRGRADIMDVNSGQLLDQAGRASLLTVKVNDQGALVFGDRIFSTNHIRIHPDRDLKLSIAGKERMYRGDIDLRKTEDNKLLVINVLDLEEYIRGVLYHEVSHRWPMAALKAQAVAARSYGLYQIQNNSAKPFDVTNDVYSQVYGGRLSERYRTNLAVSETRGEVMLYQNKVLPAYYSSNCGDYTEDSREVWNSQELIPPLQGGRCIYSRFAPHYNWKKNMRLADIQEILNANGYALGTIKEINVVERNNSHRVRTLVFITSDGKETQITGKRFREIMGANLIKSNNYEVVMKGYYCDFLGKGWGHGVGMSQWGAYVMSRHRFHYQDILLYYYPGVNFVDDQTLE